MSQSSLLGAYCLLLASVAGVGKMATGLPALVAAGPDHGVNTLLMRACTKAERIEYDMDDRLDLWFHVKADGTLWLNEDPVRWSDLPGLAGRVYASRQTKVAYLYAEGEAPYGLVARTGATLQASVAGLILFLPTRALMPNEDSATCMRAVSWHALQ